MKNLLRLGLVVIIGCHTSATTGIASGGGGGAAPTGPCAGHNAGAPCIIDTCMGKCSPDGVCLADISFVDGATLCATNEIPDSG